MPRYYFDLHNDMDSIDEEGREASDSHAAQRLAIAEVLEMAAASITDHGQIDLAHYIQIRDESGAVMRKVRFDEVVAFRREGKRV